MKRYKSHKIVEAAKIVNVDRSNDAVSIAVDGGEVVSVSGDKHGVRYAEPGGYLIRYADGYMSYSPAKAFEEGYHPIDF